MQRVVRSNPKNAGETEFPLFYRDAAFRVGEINAPIGPADYVVRTVESPPLPPVRHRRYRSIRIHPRDLPVRAFAHQQPALAIEGAAVAFPGIGANRDRIAAAVPTHQHAFPVADVGQIVAGMPQRPLGGPASGDQVGITRLNDCRKVFRHGYSLPGLSPKTWL